jgi:serine/threonine-protein kinase RsbW
MAAMSEHSSSEPSPEPRTRRLAVPAAVDELAGVRAFVRESSARLGAEPAVIGDVVQAVDECLTNAIIHGYRGREGSVEVELERSGANLVVRLKDQAPPFDPTKTPGPDLSLPLERRPPGGMGVYLARELMDEMTYRQTDEGNELTLVKECRTGQEESDAEHRS